ncbi:MAG: hypothetical protein RI554_11240 [Trueperaceae bacterium]|nr:hypothetical protein [Trueperaceae bacterium]
MRAAPSPRRSPRSAALARGVAAFAFVALALGACGGGDAPQRERTLTATLDGAGRVASEPAGLDCDGSCSAPFPEGARVRLTATPDDGHDVAGWTGCDATSGATCTVTLDADRDVTVRFTPTLDAPEVGTPLELRTDGAGAGLIESDPEGLRCREDCRATFPASAEVTLRAYPDDGAAFGGWEGCDRTRGATCTVTLTSPRTVRATFDVAATATPTLRVAREGGGAGRVTADAVGLDCGEACSAPVPEGATVFLTATPDAGSRLTGWDGCDATDGATCTVAPNGDRDVVARFEVERRDAALRLDAAACADATCRGDVGLAGTGATWGGLAFDATSDAFEVLTADPPAGLDACLISAGATRVALVCPTPVDLDAAPLGLDLRRTAGGPATLTLNRAEALPYDGGRYPVGGARVPIGGAP